MTRRVVVVGADGTGMSAASQALRRAGREALDVVAFERGHHVSYSACGIPYWVAGDVDGADALIAPQCRRAPGGCSARCWWAGKARESGSTCVPAHLQGRSDDSVTPV